MARLAREENEALKARIAALEAKVAAAPGQARPTPRRRPAGHPRLCEVGLMNACRAARLPCPASIEPFPCICRRPSV